MPDDHPPRACKFLDPDAASAEKRGLVAGPIHPYEQHFGFAGCWHPNNRRGSQPGVCPYFAQGNFSDCEIRELEATEILEWQAVKLDDGYTHVLLDFCRYGPGVGEYRILTWHQVGDEPERGMPENPDQPHAGHTHKDHDAGVNTHKKFVDLVAGLGGEVTIMDPRPEPQSFVASLFSESA